MKKKLLAVFVLTYVTTLGLLTAVDSDIVKGFDFTGATSVTGAKLNQLVDNSYVGTNRGMIIFAVTNTAAAVAAEPKLARYIWLDSSYTPPVPKVWDGTNGYWTNITANATLTAGSVTTSILADNSVTTAKLVDGNVTAGKLGGNSVTAEKIMPSVITNGHIALYTIQSTNIATNAIASFNITASAVTGDKIAPGSIDVSSLTNGFLLQGTNIAAATITSNNVASGGIVLTNISLAGASALTVLRATAAGTALEWALPVYTNATSVVDSSTLPSSGDGVRNLAHTLAARPKLVRVVIVCTTDDSAVTGFVLDDEVELSSVYNGSQLRPFGSSADATNVIVGWSDAIMDVGAIYVMHKTTGARVALTHANWTFKAYATR